jgi:hypothetical protein
MEFKYTSRKDDMISFCYLLLFMLNDLKLPGFDNRDRSIINADTIKLYKLVKHYKQEMTL